jgi:hypothetical protein
VIDTKTPRTDAEATLSCDSGLRSAFVVHVEFARELEREIERIRAERDEARRMVCTVESALIGGRRTQRDVETLRAEIEKLRSELRNYTGDHHTIGGTRVE